MKDVLIVCYGMGCGGAEKSLISFLNRLPKDRWNVDLIVANPNGMYMKQIPFFKQSVRTGKLCHAHELA